MLDGSVGVVAWAADWGLKENELLLSCVINPKFEEELHPEL